MTVKELRKLLDEYPDDYVVILQKDTEGNGHSPLEGSWHGVYVPDSTWSGNVHLAELTEEDRGQGYTEDDLYDGDDGQFALILYPVN